MERLTKKLDDKDNYIVDNDKINQTINKLAYLKIIYGGNIFEYMGKTKNANQIFNNANYLAFNILAF